MNLTKIKKGVTLLLVGGMLVTIGCQSEAAMKKDELALNKNAIQNTQVVEKLSKEKLKEMVLKEFKEHFDVEVDTESLFEYIEISDKGYWQVSWSTFNEKKLDEANKKLFDMKGNYKEITKEEKEKLLEEIKELRTGYNKAITYYARGNGNGNIMKIGIKNRAKDEDIYGKEVKEIEVKKEEKEIALKALEDFAGQKVDVSDLNEEISMKDDSWEFFWDNEPDWDAKETKSINYGVTIDKETKEIKSVTYVDDIAKEHKTNTFPEFDTEEGKKIALDFIKEHEYVEKIDDVEFLRYWNADPQIVLFHVDYIYGQDEETGKTKVIKVTVNKRTKEIWSMGKVLESDEELKSKDHERTNKPNPNALG
ncbi:hypothetical protein [Maledivibacter halophilus]|uniref:Uncharacterized protein n=1 Tax=Maledivibacter halophilus TaxID=36842 RepID=A0A1T5KPH4_9FIRM|nr:hypothetical protein [Maledivibacter halophilus]SKC65570.1 hypothetical protein SAMN02194393_02017 [Maledivibacter halophilus]